MDPLSIAASATALIEFSARLSSGIRMIRRLSSVPREVAALLDELSDFEAILFAISSVSGQRTAQLSESPFLNGLPSLLQKAKVALAATATFCGIPFKPSTGLGDDDMPIGEATLPSMTVYSRFRWMMERRKIEEHRRRLELIRLDIAGYAATMGLNDLFNTRTDIREMTLALRKLSTDQSALKELLINTQQTRQIEDSLSPSNPIIRPMNQKTEEGSADTVSPLMSNELSALQVRKRSSSSGSSSSGQTIVEKGDEDQEWSLDTGFCCRACSCSCHRISRSATSPLYRELIGFLVMRCDGFFNPSRTCDETTCRRRPVTSIKFTYRFPPWLLDKAIHIILQRDRVGAPQLSLSCMRILPRDNTIFTYAVQGNIRGIKDLFSSGRASPYDMTDNYGWTALHYAVEYGHLNMCEFLVKAAGARSNLMDFGELTAADIAYHQVYFEEMDGAHRERLKSLFDEDEWLEHKQFTLFHKLILGLTESPQKLENQLGLSSKEVNVPDCDGRSPLSWAAEQGDQASIISLIEYGADVNMQAKDGNTPLHYACKGPEYNVVALLLKAGAKASVRNHRGQTPLNWATFFQNDTRFADELLRQEGIDVNETCMLGDTAVDNAAFRGHDNMLAFLIRAGADINHRSTDGRTPLLDTITFNYHASLRVLLSHAKAYHLDLTMEDTNAETCLHLLARDSDTETAEIFLRAMETGAVDCGSMNPSHVGKEGQTARDLVCVMTDLKAASIVEKILTIVELETEDKASLASTETVYQDTFEILPQDAGDMV